MAPTKLAVEYGLPRRWIVKGIVAALKYHHPDDRESLQLQGQLAHDGLETVLEVVWSIRRDSTLAEEIRQAWEKWEPLT